MGEKYSRYTLPELTVEYFEFEKKINELNIEESSLNEKINNLYNDRCDVYTLIRKKQDEEAEIIKKNLIKYGLKVQLNDNDNEQLNRDYDLTMSTLKNKY